MTTAQSIPLTEEELEQLEELLVSDEVPADCMNMEMLDGYLAAIVASPLPIPVEDWLPAVWTADEGEVGFGSGASLQKAIELVLRYYNDLIEMIGDEEGDEDGEAEGWQPFCYAQGGDDDPAIGEEWSNGFEQGFEMWPSEWPDKVGDTSIAEALLETILGDEEEVAVPADVETQLAELEEKGFAVQHLYQNWRALGLPAPQPVAVSAAMGAAKSGPGRNEPCPCGSGKKYKKCCGAN
ncbi:UPF0149 family protein [Zoogloea sp. LCSB751]|uniref:UPF0149 family protein n=1 Tax=Zoogloea sp. LCSB751 TaxID=1965277 RepID=UPI0009A51B2F|nr:UPF0149 family protein [Zoogloea sp. LCSB751]